jgi:hypothetical protein
MLSKHILLAFLAACGINSSRATTEPPPEQPDVRPPGEIEKDHVFFCCQDVDAAKATGEGCVTIGEKEIDRCSTVLACADNFTKKDGKVVCL